MSKMETSKALFGEKELPRNPHIGGIKFLQKKYPQAE